MNLKFIKKNNPRSWVLAKRMLNGAMLLICSISFAFSSPESESSYTNNSIKYIQQVLTGTIKDVSGLPIPGVNVVEKGTSNGTTTDFDGNFSITLTSVNATLSISYVGFFTKEIISSGENHLDIILEEKATSLNEVVVVGYGTQTKKDITGAVASVSLKDFKEAPVTNPGQLLQGTVSGLNVGTVTSAGSTPTISIRGRTTISGSETVLIVLDGIIYTQSLESINPDDIASIDVLKDASSTAVYGAQAANGVILITTKKGKRGKAKVSFTSSLTFQGPSKNLHTMNRQEQLNFIKEVMWDHAYTKESGYTKEDSSFNLASWMTDSYMVNSDGSITSTDYDWWGNGTRVGTIIENKISISGGSENISYLFSLGNVEQKNYIVNDDFSRKSIRLNLDAKINSWWKMGVQTSGAFVKKDGQEPSLWTLISMTAMTTPYNEDGTLNLLPMETARPNPFLGSDVDDKERNNYFIGNLYSEFKLPVEGLTYRFNFGNNYKARTHFQSNKYGASETGSVYKEYVNYYDYTFDNIINYKRVFGNHSIDATLLYGAIERKGESTVAEANGFSNIALGYNDLNLGENQITNSDAYSESLLYQMARVNYKYNDKYMLTATIRRDGYSGFSENNKSASFPSVALGWIISDEEFMQDLSWLNYLKVRGGYGISGNQTSRYSSLAQVTQEPGYVFGDGGSTVIRQELSSLGNTDLKWERTEGVNLGLDFTLLNSRLTGSLDIYKTITHDLLFDVSIPTITGFEEIRSNVGEVQNKGIEFTITSRNIQSDNFQWNTTFNISSNSNKVISLTGLDNDGDGKEDDLVSSGLFIGKSLTSIYGYEIEGIYQVDDDIPTGFYAGNYKVADTNGDGEYTTDDRTVIGNEDPAYRFGILNNFTYNNFSLRIFVNSIQGGKNGYLGENSAVLTQDDNARRLNRISEMASKFWSPSNPDGIYANSPNTGLITPTRYQDRSFIRLQNVTMSYNLSKYVCESIGVSSINLYVNGNNLFTMTDWEGWDPEAETDDESGQTYEGRPVMRSFTTGINVTF